MKKLFFISCLYLSATFCLNAQTNTFPTSGNVGIGTTTPSEKLEVNGSVRFTGGRLTHSGDIPNDNNAIFTNTSTSGYGIYSKGGLGTKYAFHFENQSGTSVLYGRGDGNIGIGTTNPLAGLEIFRGDTNNHALILNSSGAGWGSGMLFKNNLGTDYGIYSGADGKWHFTNEGQGDRLVIDNSGNVGIGTISPYSKLHVFEQIDGDFNGLIIDNRKNYGINSGVNETSRVLLSLSENGAENPLNRIFGIMEAATLSETDSSNGRLSFHVRESGNTNEKMRIMSNGNVGIGTTTPDSKLTVAGKIHSQEVKVTINAGADFVFNDDYNLPTLNSIETFVKKNKHLPEIASEKDMKENGLYLAEMNIKLLQKIEELTLYTIQQEKDILNQKTINRNLEERLQKVEVMLNSKKQ